MREVPLYWLDSGVLHGRCGGTLRSTILGWFRYFWHMNQLYVLSLLSFGVKIVLWQVRWEVDEANNAELNSNAKHHPQP